MHRPLIVAVAGLSLFLLGACPDEEPKTDENCGTVEAPTPVAVASISPATDSTVLNQDIQHEFVVVDPPGDLSSLSFSPGAAHTAGASEPATLRFESSADGSEHSYTATGISWANAPAAVNLQPGLFTDANSCVYSLPDLLFSYQLTPAAQAPPLEYDDNGCLTWNGASEFCGFASDDAICELAATCRPDANVDQCQIDCEMSTTGTCLEAAAVDCVWTAFQAGSCDALGDCAGWYLVP